MYIVIQKVGSTHLLLNTNKTRMHYKALNQHSTKKDYKMKLLFTLLSKDVVVK